MKRGKSEALDIERLHQLVNGFAGRRVAVLGDLVVDEFVYGDIARVSREAPVLILDHLRTEIVPGGGANSVANLAALGARPLPVGVVGRDRQGRDLIAALRRLKVATPGVVRSADYRTPAKSRVMAGGVHTRRQQVVRLDRGAPHGELTSSTLRELLRSLDKAVEGADGLLIADYGYGAAAPAALESRLKRWRKRGLTVVVDSRERVTRFRGVDACTPNQEELERAVGNEGLIDDEAMVAAGRTLLRRTGNRAVLVTVGSRGMVLIARRRPAVAVPAYGSDEVADVTGAGDTVTAVFTLALLSGATALEAARLSNYAAGIVVTKAGTATVSRAELIDAIEEDPPC